MLGIVIVIFGFIAYVLIGKEQIVDSETPNDEN